MISVEEALELIAGFDAETTTERRSVSDTLGHVLTEDIISPINMPPFPQSAMDGYALGSGAKTEGSTFDLIGEVAAGSSEQFTLGDCECVRIFTGAPVPESASAVVQQEWVERSENGITLMREVADAMHIRPLGEQMTTSDIALTKGTMITPAAVGFLSMLGLTEVEVFRKPSVQVMVTGNELASPGTELKYGQIYESNSFMLKSALKKEGIDSTSERVPDDLDQTVEKISAALSENDVLILTGGISVGDHDHVGTALQTLGVKEVFYKVNQKPGKPIFFGTKDGKAVFALPGNPAASLSCFYIYVLPILHRMAGIDGGELEQRSLPLTHDHLKNGDRAVFLKARVINGQVEVLDDQSSAMLSSFAKANALLYLDSATNELAAGSAVKVYMLS